MNTTRTPNEAQLGADPELCAKLARLIGESDPLDPLEPLDPLAPETHGHSRTDALLARIAWARIAEPGDGTAGELRAAIGPAPALKLLIDGASPAQLVSAAARAGLELTGRAAGEALGRWRPRLDRSETIADIERGIAAGLRVITPDEPSWPEALRDLGPHEPVLLWVRGDPAHLGAPSLSVVGARAATGYGTHTTAEIVSGVCAAGVAIVSGAAYGIDAVAHRAALAAGTPTVAVLAGGADRAYPGAHDSLLERVSEAGAVCAEMIPGAAPTRWRFLMRNRIIAALSGATLVTEAGLRSGTLNTAGHAAELGRTLGAVPGPITSAASAGCHKLIREYGAQLVTNAREACELIGLDDELDMRAAGGEAPGGGAASDLEPGSNTARMRSLHGRILDALPLRGGRQLSEIVRRAGVGEQDATRALAELELLGYVKRHGPGAAAPKWVLVRRE